jgi:hypothetical protein
MGGCGSRGDGYTRTLCEYRIENRMLLLGNLNAAYRVAVGCEEQCQPSSKSELCPYLLSPYVGMW